MLGTMFWQTECRSSAPTLKTYFIIWTDQSSLKSACNAKTYNISHVLCTSTSNSRTSKYRSADADRRNCSTQIAIVSEIFLQQSC